MMLDVANLKTLGLSAALAGGVSWGVYTTQLESLTASHQSIQSVPLEVAVMREQMKQMTQEMKHLNELVKKDLNHLNDRMDQHDDRVENITSRLRNLENPQ